jgi:PKD repeat protein
MRLAVARRAALVAAIAAVSACTIHDTTPPPLNGPSGLGLTLRVTAVPANLSFGVSAATPGEQSAITVLAIGADGRPVSQLPIRLNMVIDGVAQDYGTLRERNIVTGNDGTASTTYTAPPIPSSGQISNNCGSATLGTCVAIVATPASNNFGTVQPESVLLRLVPAGVILPPAQSPVASFVFQPAAPAANSPVQFDASRSCGSPLNSSGACPGTHSITTYAWNFGDGTTGSGQTISHSFPLQQTYTVTLTVTNDIGQPGSTTQVLTMGAGSLPTPIFTVSPRDAAVGQLLFFNASGSTAGQGHVITSYRWTFGDGTTGSGVTVSHAYAAAGIYVVQLTVTDESGQSKTSDDSTKVTIGSGTTGPTALFTYSPTSPVAVLSVVTFDASASTGTPGGSAPAIYQWQFDCPVGGCIGSEIVTTATSAVIQHTYQAQGNFRVQLTVFDSAGRSNSTTRLITVQ